MSYMITFLHIVKYIKKKFNNKKVKSSSLTFLKNKAKTLEDIFNNSKYIIKTAPILIKTI